MKWRGKSRGASRFTITKTRKIGSDHIIIKKFDVVFLNDDLSTKTHTVNGVKNIVMRDKDAHLTLPQLKSIINKAIKTERNKYGFSIYYKDGDTLKEIHTRDNGEYCNETLKKSDTPLSHAEKIYGIQQMELF